MTRMFALVMIVGLVAGTATGQAPPLEHMDVVLRSVPDGPVAHVNGEPIPRGDFVQLYSLELGRAKQLSGAQELDDRTRVRLGLRSLYQLVNQELLHQEAVKAGLSVPEVEIEKRWASQLQQYREAEPGLTEQEVLDGMRAQSREHVFREIERMLLIDKMTEQIAKQAGTAVDDAELGELYAKNKDALVRPDTLHIRQLFIRAGSDPAAREDAKSRAEHALARVHAGQRFEAVVKDVSDSPRATKGGEMGPWPLAEFPPFLSEPSLKLDPGQISGVIESEYGFHIVQLIGVEEGSDLSFDAAKPFLERTLLAKKSEEAVLDYCDKLVNGGSDILVYLDLEKTLATDPRLRNMLEPGGQS